MNRLFSFLILAYCFMFGLPVFAGEDRVQLRVAYEPELAPFNHRVGSQAEGFAIDLLKEIAINQSVTVDFVPLVKEDALKKIASGEIDIIVSIPYSTQLTDIVEYTDSFFSSSIGILAPKENDQIATLSSLSDVLVALQSHTLEYDFLKNIRGIRYQVCNSQHTALKFFFAGRADVFVGTIDTTNYYLDKYKLHSKYQFSNTYFMPAEYSFAVQKNNYKLLSTLNKGIRRLKSSGAYSRIFKKWFDKDAKAISGLVRLIWEIGAAVVTFFLLVLFLGMRWNRQLKRQVAHKTKDLERLNESLTKQMEIAQNNNEFLKQVLDSSPRGIIILDRKGFITKNNKIVFDFLGHTESLKGKHYDEIPLIANLLGGKIDTVFSGQKKHYLGEHEEFSKDGKRASQLRYYVYPLYQYNQEIIGLILTFEDVTAELEVRKKMFEQEKNRALSRMVAGIAHEVRNPLSSIKTFVELIPRKIHNEKFQKEISTSVPQEIVRINRLIEGLISYAKPRQIKYELVSIKKLVDESAILFLHSMRNKGFSLIHTDVEDLMIVNDHDLVKQIIINLIINAIDALDEASQAGRENIIELKSQRIANRVCIQVIDSGIGMTPEEKVNAMEPFYTTKPKGTGLGLPLVQQLVHESNAELIIESEKYVGTTVSIYFELA